MAKSQTETTAVRARTTALFAAVLLVSTCGLVYELAAGALASYVLGDSVTQFSLVIGIYLSAMGLGAHFSRYLEKGLARRFVELELAVALVGGFSVPLLFLSFGRMSHFRPILFGVVALVGTLVGVEIPLFLRILRQRLEFKDLVANVLSVDYLGALVASLLFPLLLVPRLGLVRTSLAMGLLNALVGLWSTWLLAEELPALGWMRVRCALVILACATGLAGANWMTSLAEEALFADPIIYSRQSAYQRIVITAGRGSFQLFLDGNLQFSSADEYRYHEALVHPAFAAAARRENALVLGGGDGLALREILKYPEVRRVTLVDIDPAMTSLAVNLPMVRALNNGAFFDSRVTVVHEDALAWLADLPAEERFDVVIVDFPDPNNFSLGKLYTTRFYRLLRAHLAQGGAAAIQSTSPLLARTSFWCIATTLEAAGLFVRPMHVAVPSFGEWGFALVREGPFEVPAHVPAGLRFLSDGVLPGLFQFGPDVARVPAEVNRLDNQILVQYYEAEWSRFE
ncbi:MAG: polyamine aminopropyltransferase [Myxococcaceae bacterium]